MLVGSRLCSVIEGVYRTKELVSVLLDKVSSKLEECMIVSYALHGAMSLNAFKYDNSHGTATLSLDNMYL